MQCRMSTNDHVHQREMLSSLVKKVSDDDANMGVR